MTKTSIRFLTSQDQVQKKSGNPGYLSGFPVLIGRQGDVAMEVYENGFQLTGADRNGACILNSDLPSSYETIDLGDPVLTF
mmetsp:Transcript_40286/g.38754  ORF Transcript_40286/g.38754 Transcript_40286/m.38754 type:complete len:81 (+) Transcript_40286:1003-1245(+)|eukprot:CAMPEP_0170558974 /NCGR_PEP_ID=MMETSP0211-20121228/39396_1 /TAXON_ID=311385 /ORGANISM="Pseudokeronopsis sp., Strain OXSARD2" /LENGTH=80 /DNA_ID=CAMNT_0010871507 /DNA_START=238 /DNA_END=480 /DNA_ORIENTATION=+